jgi:curved DNA-binding protein
VDYYEILGLKHNASSTEIRRAYRKLVRRIHPDVNPSPQAEESFKKISQAYDTLSDDNKRASYDQKLKYEKGQRDTDRSSSYQRSHYKRYREQASTFNQPYDDLRKVQASSTDEVSLSKQVSIAFNSLKESFRRLRFKNPLTPIKNSLSVIEVLVSIEEAIVGVKKTVEIDPLIQRKITVRIPAGVRTGSIIRLRSRSGGGEELLVVVRLLPHPYLRIEQKGLIAEIPITIKEAIEGQSIRIPTLDEPVTIVVPPGTQSGKEFCLRGRGIRLRGREPGDLYIRFLVYIPEIIDKGVASESTAKIEALYQQSPRAGLGSRLN